MNTEIKKLNDSPLVNGAFYYHTRYLLSGKISLICRCVDTHRELQASKGMNTESEVKDYINGILDTYAIIDNYAFLIGNM